VLCKHHRIPLVEMFQTQVTLCVGLCLLSVPFWPLSESLSTPSPGAYSGFQLRVGVRVNYGHKGKCPGRDLSLGKEIGVPPPNVSPTDEEV